MLASACGPSPTTNRALDPSNELPFGHVDTPTDGASVPSQVTLGGWAMDDHGIKQVRVYIDNHFADAAVDNTPRPDVTKVFPSYARGSDLHGWTMLISFDAPGRHAVLVQAVDSDGATRDIGALTLTSQ